MFSDMLDMKRENKRLYHRIDELRQQQLDLESQVERLQEELAVEYLLRRDESDARKLLISDMNDLRYQQEDNVARKTVQESEQEKDDPLTLKMALKLVNSLEIKQEILVAIVRRFSLLEEENCFVHKIQEYHVNYQDIILCLRTLSSWLDGSILALSFIKCNYSECL
jgi:DNA-binding XRE family transcriptional regulator